MNSLDTAKLNSYPREPESYIHLSGERNRNEAHNKVNSPASSKAVSKSIVFLISQM